MASMTRAHRAPASAAATARSAGSSSSGRLPETRAMARNLRASLRWCLATTLAAMPYSQGRAEARSCSKADRRSKAIRKTSPSRSSASAGSTRRARKRRSVDPCRSKMAPKAPGVSSESAITAPSDSSMPSCSPFPRSWFRRSLSHHRGPAGNQGTVRGEQQGSEPGARDQHAHRRRQEDRMRAIRIMANLRVADVDAAKSFYTGYLGLSTEEFNMGWVARYTSPDTGANVQLVTRDATASDDFVIDTATT